MDWGLVVDGGVARSGRLGVVERGRPWAAEDSFLVGLAGGVDSGARASGNAGFGWCWLVVEGLGAGELCAWSRAGLGHQLGSWVRARWASRLVKSWRSAEAGVVSVGAPVAGMPSLSDGAGPDEAPISVRVGSAVLVAVGSGRVWSDVGGLCSGDALSGGLAASWARSVWNSASVGW